ncbi:MAG: inorganic phosphate transporter [Chloroflexi bacterium]|nr:inorganic phosphate transporter [Chloroflexota bacterium]MBL6960923.1 inorganic phosphate transporter [Anaerolineales bacterium]
MPPILIIMIALAIIFDFLNGIHDSSNIVATMISSRAFSPRVALGVTAISHFIAPFIFGVAVATTIGHEVVASEAITLNILLAALSSAIIWNLLTWFFGIPSSSSHALIGGMIGAVAVGAGVNAIELAGMKKILIALFTSPIIGLLLGYFFTKLIFSLARGATPKINIFFKRFQIISAIALSLSHGTNDAQKTMGIITLGLVTAGIIPDFKVPLWVITISAVAIALGTALGGWKLIKTLGGKFYKIRPVHGFSSQLTSAIVILGASIVGGPVSTTQVVSSSIMGVGSAQRVKMVRWGVAKEIIVAWIITIPITMVMAAGIYWLIEKLL